MSRANQGSVDRANGAPCIALVGHCGVDGPQLEKFLRSQLSECRVERINDDPALEAICSEADLLLINREPVGFEGTGLDLLRRAREANPNVRVMLISDKPEAQEEATSAGAVPGFGKGALGTDQPMERIRKALGDSEV